MYYRCAINQSSTGYGVINVKKEKEAWQKIWQGVCLMIPQSQAASYAYQAGFTGPSLNLIVGASSAQGEKGLNTLQDFQNAFKATSGGTNLAAIPEFRTGTAQAQTYDWWSALQAGIPIGISTVVNNPGQIIQSAGLNPVTDIANALGGLKQLGTNTAFVMTGIILAILGLALIVMTPQHIQTITGVAKNAAAGAALAG